MWPVQPITLGWRQNTSRSVYFASWRKTDTAWVYNAKNISVSYRQWKIENIGIGLKKPIGWAGIKLKWLMQIGYDEPTHKESYSTL